jgi:hypothetical protein
MSRANVYRERQALTFVRAGWKGARWLGEDRKPFDILAALAAAGNAGVLDRPIWVARKKAAPLALRLVAFRKPPEAAAASRVKARQAREAGRLCHLWRHAGGCRVGHSYRFP